MAVGQAVLAGSSDVDALQAVERALEAAGQDDGRVHARILRAALAVEAEYSSRGMPLSGQPQAAVLLRCSEYRAGRLLHEGRLLAQLPEALDALEWGLLTPEQSAVVVTQLDKLAPRHQLEVWLRLLAQLRADAERGVTWPPGRLTELLRGWVIEVDPQDATERRKRAEEDRTIDYRKREDGLVDLFLIGMRPPDAQAALQRIRAEAEPVGLFDLRTADQRRHDAMVSILLGRTSSSGCGGGMPDAAPCGCLPGTGAPCGVDSAVMVPIESGLGTGDQPAELVGHGPIEPDLLQAILLNAPRLRPVFVDSAGTPVAIGDRVLVPERGSPAALREALLGIAEMRPPRVWPRHPLDHPPDPPGPPDLAPTPPPPSRSALSVRHDELGVAHPEGAPGAYRPSRALRRLIQLRAPRCEFPGCGARAVRCDAEHDLAWPKGPTCSCNLGPCCRRHHRVKQEGWVKARSLSGVRWSSPSGRPWLSPLQHRPVAPAVRGLGPLPSAPDDFDQLSPLLQEEELWWLAECPDDPEGLELRAVDVDPDLEDDGDCVGELLANAATRWTLDLLDPYAWLDLVPTS